MKPPNDYIKPRKRSAVPVPSGRELLKKKLGPVISAIPSVGSIARMFFEQIPSDHDKRMRDFLRDVEDRITAIEDEIDQDRLQSPHFKALLTGVAWNLIRDYQEEKLRAYRTILINSLTNPLDDDLQEVYLMMVGQLPTVSMHVLRVIASKASLPERLGIAAKTQMTYGDMLRPLLPGLEDESIRTALRIPQDNGIIRAALLPKYDQTTALNEQELRGQLSPLGQKFVMFVIEGATDTPG